MPKWWDRVIGKPPELPSPPREESPVIKELEQTVTRQEAEARNLIFELRRVERLTARRQK